MVRFDKPCLKVSGAVGYFREHMLGDYLTQESQVEMTWQGAGAGRLGLVGPCRLEAFEHLCEGRDPDSGRKLMVRDKGAHRRVCFFAQISPPKDVSIACLVGGDQRIAGWWDEAVRETLLEIEATTATRVRRGGGNSDRTTAEMVAAVVTHDTNRALDPQLHTHVCIMNLTYDALEERWKGVQPSGFYRHQGYFREVCYNRLAFRLQEAGYRIERVRGIGFSLTGFPAELRECFSKRRREILRQAAEAGAAGQDDLQAITARSRAEKTQATATQLRTGWIREAGSLLANLQAMIAKAGAQAGRQPVVEPTQALASAEAHLFERRSVVDHRLLLREALIAGRGTGELPALKAAVERRVAAGDLLRVGDNLASRETLQAENEFLRWAEAHRGGVAPLGDRTAAQDLAADDQRDAVTQLLKSPSRILIFQGDAGTGKTTSLKSVIAGIERSGGRVFGCAPSAGATEVLRRELTADADTLQQLLANPGLQERSAGRVIIVDEAGLISVRELRDLCRVAAAHGNRLLLVGDTKQHTAVEAGDALRCLQKFTRVPVVRLTRIRRQHDPDYREAVARLARGDAFGAFNQLAKLGAVRQERDRSKLLVLAAADYVQTIRAGRSCLVISPVWSEINEFTQVVRAQLKAAGQLAPKEHAWSTVHSLKWTREERRRVDNYRPGDVLTFPRALQGFAPNEHATVERIEAGVLVLRRSDSSLGRLYPRRLSGFDVGVAKEIGVAIGDRLLIRANLKSSRLKNGDLVDVVGFSTVGALLLKDGRSIPITFRQFSHGYASTSHGAQGKTVDRGILLMADEGIAAGNLKQAYVSNSRFRESQMIYTTDLAGAREAMRRPADRMLAFELVRLMHAAPSATIHPVSPHALAELAGAGSTHLTRVSARMKSP
jgi:conjugative relaxase-like TrwC/TraI family protein